MNPNFFSGVWVSFVVGGWWGVLDWLGVERLEGLDGLEDWEGAEGGDSKSIPHRQPVWSNSHRLQGLVEANFVGTGESENAVLGRVGAEKTRRCVGKGRGVDALCGQRLLFCVP